MSSSTWLVSRWIASVVNAATCGVATMRGWPDERVAGRHGLALEHVDGRGGDPPALERGEERPAVDQGAARGVDEVHAVAHRGERLAPDHRARRLVELAVQRHQFGASEQLLEREPLDSVFRGLLARHPGIEPDDPGADRSQQAGDGETDVAETDQADRSCSRAPGRECRSSATLRPEAARRLPGSA